MYKHIYPRQISLFSLLLTIIAIQKPKNGEFYAVSTVGSQEHDWTSGARATATALPTVAPAPPSPPWNVACRDVGTDPSGDPTVLCWNPLGKP